jgi:hypothetical protein
MPFARLTLLGCRLSFRRISWDSMRIPSRRMTLARMALVGTRVALVERRVTFGRVALVEKRIAYFEKRVSLGVLGVVGGPSIRQVDR